MYGPIKRVKIIKDKNEKSRGYAFVEYEHKSDFKNAYKKGDRKRIDESRVHVDYERGRTEKNWRPRRFGGGKGELRPYPSWLEKELNDIKEFFPELLIKNRKEIKDESPQRKRSRSRHDEEDVNINGSFKDQPEYEVLKESVIENDVVISNAEEEEKKKKKDKKEKKTKKEKKSKKDKKEKKDRRIAKEEGEII